MFLSQLLQASAEGQSDLRHLFANTPASTPHLMAFTQAVMRDGPLAADECELIAAMVSEQNHCLF